MKKAFKNFPSLGRGVRGEGFTLAEVLITLMIIGIVAALTIPSVISNYQQQEFKTGLKKAVSVLNEAIQMNIVHEGETPYENGDLFSYLKRHMSVLNESALESAITYANRYYGGSRQSTDYHINNAFYTTDGMRFEVYKTYGKPGDFGSTYYGSPEEQTHLSLYESGLNPLSMKSNPVYGLNNYSSCKDGSVASCANKASVSGFCGSYGLENNHNNTINTPCIITVDVNGDKKPNPSIPFVASKGYIQNGVNGATYYRATARQDENLKYTYPSPTDKKLQDMFTIMITDEKAIPFGVVAQRAMYSK